MGYMTSSQGDYMGGYAGDPGFFSKLLKIGGKLVGSFLGGSPPPAPVYIQQAAPRPQYRQAQAFSIGGPRGLVIDPRPQVKAAAFLPPGGPRVTPGMGGPRLDPRTGFPVKRRRMNPANPKALRRAIRRQAGFVKLARRALKGSGYQIVSRGSRAKRVNVREAGSGSVTIQG